jgi:hypothetical protein
MQVLDQKVAPPLAIAKQPLDLAESGGVDLPALRVIRPAPAPGARMDTAIVPYGR